MSLKPIDPRQLRSDDVEQGSGARFDNSARAMNHYGSSQRRRSGSDALSPDSTGAMRTYAAHAGSAVPRDRRKTLIVAAAIVVLLAAMGVGIALGVRSCSEAPSEVQLEGSVTLTIPSGYGAGDISQILRDNGVIASTTEFMQTVTQLDAGEALKAGTYTFDRGADYSSIVEMLVQGPEASGVSLTIPEGLTIEQTAQRVEEVLGIPAADFLAQAKASNYVGEFTFLANAYNDSLEGFLFPLTYTFAEGVTADTVIRTMLQQFQTETASLNWNTVSLADGTVLSQYQVLVLASLIERETAVADERPLVSSVIVNRLNAGMPIQIDAVIAYVLNKSDLITNDDLATVASQYPEWDVYNNTGLPPAPICSPSLDSIQAALAPAATGYLYYVAAPALDGTHTFCTTDEEFAAAFAAYNQAAGIA